MLVPAKTAFTIEFHLFHPQTPHGFKKPDDIGPSTVQAIARTEIIG